jgi:hypothetical protein
MDWLFFQAVLSRKNKKKQRDENRIPFARINCGSASVTGRRGWSIRHRVAFSSEKSQIFALQNLPRCHIYLGNTLRSRGRFYMRGGCIACPITRASNFYANLVTSTQRSVAIGTTIFAQANMRDLTRLTGKTQWRAYANRVIIKLQT